MSVSNILKEELQLLYAATVAFAMLRQPVKPRLRDQLIDKNDEADGTNEPSEKWSAQDAFQKSKSSDASDEDYSPRHTRDYTSNPGIEFVALVSCFINGSLYHSTQ